MFGSYSVCNIIVLLNMLIAMMSNSYTIISERSDMEWKFARSKAQTILHSLYYGKFILSLHTGKLWISYFEEGSTVPPPFNVIPTPKSFYRIFFCQSKKKKKFTQAQREDAEDRYLG